MGNAQVKKTALVLWSLALFATTFALHSRHRDFAWYYHPDEDSKIAQVVTEKWNFNHPMLLLRASKIALDASGAARDPQSVVEVGRAVSAGFTALAVVALSLFAFQWRGWLAALSAGGALMLHHQLFELSHYMKEDTALLCGLGLALLALGHFEARPSLVNAAVLGGACALAISGKYVGAVVLLATGPTLVQGGDWQLRCSFFAGLAAVLLAVNWPLVSDPLTFSASLARETQFVVEGQKGSTRSVPHAQYWNVFIDNTTPAIWLLLVLFLAARWGGWRAITLTRWHIVAFPFVFALALSFSPKSNDRYFLPATAVFTLLAALGVPDVARVCRREWAAPLAALLLVLGQLPSWLRYERAFQRDDSRELQEWCRTVLPADAVIAKDSRIWLPDAAKPDGVPADAIPQKVWPAKFAADLGTLDELRAKGITHVAVSESDYGRFFLKSLQPKKGEEQDFARRKAFYESLFRDRDPLFERERGTVIYLHPGIRVYRIGQ